MLLNWHFLLATCYTGKILTSSCQQTVPKKAVFSWRSLCLFVLLQALFVRQICLHWVSWAEMVSKPWVWRGELWFVLHVVPKMGLFQVFSDVTVMLGGFWVASFGWKEAGRSSSLQPPVYLAQLPVMGSQCHLSSLIFILLMCSLSLALNHLGGHLHSWSLLAYGYFKLFYCSTSLKDNR